MYFRRLSLRSLEYFHVNEDCKREESTSSKLLFFFPDHVLACLKFLSAQTKMPDFHFTNASFKQK